MKQVDEMPTSGQFVAVWCNIKDRVWSDTLKWFGVELFSFVNADEENYPDELFSKQENPEFYKSVGAKYFIAD